MKALTVPQAPLGDAKAAAAEPTSIFLDGQPKDAEHRCVALGWVQKALDEGMPMKEIGHSFGR